MLSLLNNHSFNRLTHPSLYVEGGTTGLTAAVFGRDKQGWTRNCPGRQSP